MTRVCVILVLFAAVVLLPTPASAHRPYFRGEPAAVALPAGESGLIRLLYGDGILGPDPVRPVVTDAAGGVRAIAPTGYAASYSCAAQSCRVYVYRNTMLLPHVFDTDVPTMKVSAALRTADDNDLDAVLRSTEPYYGFNHIPNLSARIFGAFACLAHWWGSFAFLVLVGSTLLPVWIFLRMALDRREQNRWGSVLCILFAVAVTLPMLAAWLMFLFVSAYPPLLSLIPLALPTAVLLALYVRRTLWVRGAS
jgi:hypothetical protein